MAKILLVMCFIALTACDSSFTGRDKIPIGPSVNGWKVGACYRMVSRDPFETVEIIKHITDHKSGYIQYRYYFGENMGWGDKTSGTDILRELYQEIPCPESKWD